VAPRIVLIAEDDRDLVGIIRLALEDAGYTVVVLCDTTSRSLRARVEQLEPGCVILDGQGPQGYGGSWAAATWLHSRPRSIPAIMLTGDLEAVREAQHGTSERARAAAFVATLAKPFNLDDLVAAVDLAIGRTRRLDGAGPRLLNTEHMA
jgi:DNA-binding response OmpR family regulator